MWNFVNPLLQFVVFWILFGACCGPGRSPHQASKPYAIFLFVGLLPWTFFATSLQSGPPRSSRTRRSSRRCACRAAPPAASVLSALANFLLSFVVLLAILGFRPHPEGLVWIPLLVALSDRDESRLRVSAQRARRVLLRRAAHPRDPAARLVFLTPVLFPVAVLNDRPEQLRLLYLNPMTAIIVAYQRALLDGLGRSGMRSVLGRIALVLFVDRFWYFDRAQG